MELVPITNDIVEEYKDLYVKETGLGVESDDVFRATLETAYQYVVDRSDWFDITMDKTGKQLVFDRARYVRANASELFYDNYFADLNNFGLKLVMERDNDDVAQDDS